MNKQVVRRQERAAERKALRDARTAGEQLALLRERTGNSAKETKRLKKQEHQAMKGIGGN